MTKGRPVLIGFAIGAVCQAAQASPTTDGYRRMYDAARRCFVVNANFARSFEKIGDVANAKLFDGKARTAYDMAFYSAKELGIPEEQVKRDVDAATQAELPRLVRDQAYLTASAKFCKERGMM